MPADVLGSGTQATGSAVSGTYVNSTTALPYSSLGGINNVTLAFNGMGSVAGATVVGKTYNSTIAIGTGKKGQIETLIDVGAQVASLSSTNNLVPRHRSWGVEIEYFSTKPFLVLPFIFQATYGSTWTVGRQATSSSIPYEIAQWLETTEYGYSLGPIQHSRAFYDNGTLRFGVKLQLDVTRLANLYAKGYAKLELESRPTGLPDFIIGHAVFSDEAQTITFVGSEVVLLKQVSRKPNWSA